jgi:hypothetical protein
MQDLNRRFSKENTQIACKHRRRCSSSSSLRKMTSKATWDTALYLLEYCDLKTQIITNTGEMWRNCKSNTTYGILDWCSHFGKPLEVSQSVKFNILPYYSSVPLLDIYSTKWQCVYAKICTQMIIATLFITSK